MVSNASGTLVWYVEYGHGLAFMEISLTNVNSISFGDFFDLSRITHPKFKLGSNVLYTQ